MNEESPSKPAPRGPFRYSLRTMLVAVTLLCCYLAWESGKVHERKSLLKELRRKAGYSVIAAEEWASRPAPGGLAIRPAASISWFRRLQGDEAIQQIWYAPYHLQTTPHEIKRLAKTFPEAELLEELPLEPCHPGCFPRGTLVETPLGPRTIQDIRAGDLVTTILPSGETASAAVQAVFVTRNRLWKVETEGGLLTTTETQPLCTAAGLPRGAGQLTMGDTVLRREGGQVLSAAVVGVQDTERIEEVFNLIIGDSEFFVAGGFLARSKPPTQPAER